MKLLLSNILQRLGNEYIMNHVRVARLYCVNQGSWVFVPKGAAERIDFGKTDSDNIHSPS